MREVAALAGVGLKTVSRVFNDVPTVHPDLVARTRLAAQRLGYRPNIAASNLRRRDGRTATIGLLLDDVGNPYSAAVHRAVENVARRRDCLVLTGSLDEDPIRERELTHTLLGRQVDGLIIVPAADDQAYLAPEQQTGTPVVFLDRPPILLRADAVVADNRAAAAAAVGRLITAGHRRIACLSDRPGIYTAHERRAGYADALRAAGLAPDADLVVDDLRTIDAAAVAVSGLLALAEPPTALFTSQNLLTVGAVRALQSLGAQHRIALVGFDDFLLADILDPPVMVIAQDAAEMGTLAAELLFAQIGGAPNTGKLHEVATRLIRRQSGEIAPAGGLAHPR
jgi:LacI family transcriptional regulator